jgi:hypothetical protein
MSAEASNPGPLVAALFRCARWLMPAGSIDWIDAMEAESWQTGAGARRVYWALGCLSVAIARRVDAMLIGNLKISRWVLAPELLLCFGPLAFGWTDAVWGISGVTTLTAENIQQFFLNTPRGTFMLIYMILEAVLGVLGPITLALGTAFVIFNRPILSRRALTLLLAVAGGIALIFIARLLFDFVAPDSDPNFGGFAGVMLLFAILPAAGLVHMYHLGRSARTAPVK